MRYHLFASLFAVLVFAKLIMAAEPTDVVPAALHAVLKKNVGHARDLLDQKDFKSVAQSAGNMHLLAELLKARSDDAAWQASTDNVVAATNGLQSAARDEDAAKCRAALAAIEKEPLRAPG